MALQNMKTASSTPQESGFDAPGAATQPKANGPASTGGGPIIHSRTPEENAKTLDAFFARARSVLAERRAAAEAARPALARLCEVLCKRSGQPYKLRALLYSIYNGQAASLIEIVCLDWEIRKDLCAVLLAFGFEDRRDATVSFFYDELKAAITAAGQWDWFIQADEESEAK